MSCVDPEMYMLCDRCEKLEDKSEENLCEECARMMEVAHDNMQWHMYETSDEYTGGRW